MDIYRGGQPPETVAAWMKSMPADATQIEDLGFEVALLVAGLALAAAALLRQEPFLRGLMGEWRVRSYLRRHKVQAAHDLLLPRADGKGWTQVDHRPSCRTVSSFWKPRT